MHDAHLKRENFFVDFFTRKYRAFAKNPYRDPNIFHAKKISKKPTRFSAKNKRSFFYSSQKKMEGMETAGKKPGC